MNKKVRIGLRTAYIIVGVLILTLIVLFLCRNQLLHYFAEKKIQEVEAEYGLNIRYNKLQFNGMREVELDKFSVVPYQRDTLLNMQTMKLKLKILPLLFGNIELNDMQVRQMALTLIKRDTISNYDFLFKKKKSDSTEVKKRDYADRINKLLNLFYNYLPENGTLQN